MAEKNTYKFGLYGRCPACKDITLEVCDGCGSKDTFTDSSKSGIVVCTKCNMEHSISCEKKSCSNQIKVLKTPKNEDERTRIDEFIYRKKHKDMDNRQFVIKEAATKKIVKEVEVPIEDVAEKSGIIKLDAGMEELLAGTRKSTLEKTDYEPPVSSAPKSTQSNINIGFKKESFIQDESFIKEQVEPEIKVEEEKQISPTIIKDETIVEKEEIILEKKIEPIVEKKTEPVVEKKEEISLNFGNDSVDEEDGDIEGEIDLKGKDAASKDDELPSEVKQELDLIKDYWNKKELSEKEEKKEEERRIVNQFYDEQEDTALDKKINFENVYNEISYFDCKVCGKEEQKITCSQCGQTNQFSLNYDALSCKCGNQIKVMTCDCGAKHGHSDFYLISEGIKWQYSKSKSYYNYRKGRLLVFSTCPTCNVFTVEKCKVCGSKVNFGAPNKNNEVYCKNCGTVNQFICDNRQCDNSVKVLKNPSSIEEKLDLLNEVMNFKTRINEKKVKYSEPGGDKKVASSSKGGVSIGNVSSTPDFTNSFIEEFDSKTKELITNSFIQEVETEVNQRKKVGDELRNFNRDNFAPRAPGISLGGVKVDEEADEEENVISFDDSSKGGMFYIILILVVIAIGAGGWYVYENFIKNGSDPIDTPAPKEVVIEKPVVEEIPVVVDSEAAVVDSTTVISDSTKVVEEAGAEKSVPVEDNK